MARRAKAVGALFKELNKCLGTTTIQQRDHIQKVLATVMQVSQSTYHYGRLTAFSLFIVCYFMCYRHSTHSKECCLFLCDGMLQGGMDGALEEVWAAKKETGEQPEDDQIVHALLVKK